MRRREKGGGGCLTLEVRVSQDSAENSWVPVAEFPDHGFLFGVCAPLTGCQLSFLHI